MNNPVCKDCATNEAYEKLQAENKELKEKLLFQDVTVLPEKDAEIQKLREALEKIGKIVEEEMNLAENQFLLLLKT